MCFGMLKTDGRIILFETVFIVILAAFAIGGIWAFAVSKKVKKEGIETEAVVSRVEIHEWTGGTGDTWAQNNVTEEYYITYTNQEGQTVEAMLTNPGSNTFKKGDRIKIKYLPGRQDYPVLVEILWNGDNEYRK